MSKIPVENLTYLSNREQTSFKQVQKLYDERKYAKALKQNDALLKKHPGCLELLALKCLICRNIPDMKGEGLVAVKLALRLDMKSAVSWHALGSFYRMEGDLSQALSSFKQAYRHDSSNSQIQKDLSYLYLLLQQYDNFLELRQKMLTSQSDSRLNWVSVALALHLAGKHTEAAEHLMQWSSLPHTGSYTPQWETELRLYTVWIMEEGGDFNRAYNHISTALKYEGLTDIIGALTMKARLELRLKKYTYARSTYIELLKLLPQNTDYLFGCLLANPELASHYLGQDVYKAFDHHTVSLTKETAFRTTETASPTEETASPCCLWAEVLPDILTTRGVRSNKFLSSVISRLGLDFSDVLDASSRGVGPDGHLQTFWNDGSTWHTLYIAKRHEDTSRRDTETAKRGTETATADMERKKNWDMELCEYVDKLWNDAGLKKNDVVRCFPLCLVTDVSIFKSRLAEVFTKKVEKCSMALIPMLESFLVGPKKQQQWAREVLEEVAAAVNAREDMLAGEKLMCASLVQIAQGIDEVKFVHNYERGIEMIEEVCNRLPACTDFLVIKGSILASFGNYQEAVDLAVKARLMDCADRYLNENAVKAQLAARDIEGAVATSKDFNKQAENKEKMEPMDLQNFTLEFCFADYHLKQGDFEQAARRYELIVSRFHNIYRESQDFYLYCLRRGSFRSFVEYLRINNKMFANKDFLKAAVALVDIYLGLKDGLYDLAKSNTKLSEEPWPASVNFDFKKSAAEPLKAAQPFVAAMLSDRAQKGDIKANQRGYLYYIRTDGDYNLETAKSCLLRIRDDIFPNAGWRNTKLFPYVFHLRYCCNEELEANYLPESTSEILKYLGDLMSSECLKDNVAAFKTCSLVLRSARCMMGGGASEELLKDVKELVDVSVGRLSSMYKSPSLLRVMPRIVRECLLCDLTDLAAKL